MGDAVDVTGVSFTYRGAERPALQDVSLSLDPGEMCYLMGRTGAGKSTLCRCLNGVIPQMQPGEFTGQVFVGDEAISGRPVYETARRVGMLFQDFEAQLLASDVEREVAFGLENAGMSGEEMRRRVPLLLEMMELTHCIGRDPATLSGGEKQRLALAAVLAPSPSVLVLDEPTTDIDPQGKRWLGDFLLNTSRDGITMLIADHETGDALEAESLAVLREGALAFDGEPELFARLGLKSRPLTAGDALRYLLDFQWSLDPWECHELELEDGGEVGDPLIEVEGVSFRYPEAREPALQDVTFTIAEGEFVVILGENGSGKSTLARHLNGLLSPTSGSVRVDGRDTRSTPVREMAAQVGYLFQNPDHQIFASTVREEVGFGPRNLGVDEAEVERRVAEALEVVELRGSEEASPFVLTKGERQRVALASVLACRPRVIVFDEPTTGLDGLQQRAMMELLRRLNGEGHTIIVITHCTWAAAEYARRAIVLDQGRLAADAPVRQVFGDDALLKRTGPVRPDVTELSQRLGKHTLLSIDELDRCLRRHGGRNL